MRWLVAVTVSTLTVAMAVAQIPTPEPAALRLVKVSHTNTVAGVVLEFTFDSDVSQRVSELSCSCARKQAVGDPVSPLAPAVEVVANSPTTGKITLAPADVKDTSLVECTLGYTPPGGVKRNIITTAVDVSLRRELTDKTTELVKANDALDRWIRGVASAQKPTLGGVVEFPRRAIVKLTNANPCGRYQVKAQTLGETPRLSKPSSAGSDSPTLELTGLTPGKPYDIEFYQLDKDDKPIPVTVDTKMAGVNTLTSADKVAFTSQGATPVEGGIIVQATTSIPAVLVVDTREYDPKTGTGQPPKLGTPWEKDGYDRPVQKNLTTSFKVPIALEPGKTYQYRLHGVNADGSEEPTEWSAAVTTQSVFDFAAPVEIAVTPVGFVVSWESSVVPDNASITVDYEDRDDLIASKDKPGTTSVSMALGPSASKEFLQTMIAAQQTTTNTSTTTAKPKPPKLVVQMKKDVATPNGTVSRSVKREFRILLPQEKEETKAVMANLSLTKDEKDKLVDAAAKTIEGSGRFSRGTKFNWGGVFNVALRILAGGV